MMILDVLMIDHQSTNQNNIINVASKLDTIHSRINNNINNERLENNNNSNN